jgi:Na+/H+ antiporter NhaC
MLRYFALLLVVGLVLLAFRGFAVKRGARAAAVPLAHWPWLLLPLVLVVVLAVGLGLRQWALGR